MGRDVYEGTRKIEAPDMSEVDDPNFKYAVMEKIWQEEQMKKQALGSAVSGFVNFGAARRAAVCV